MGEERRQELEHGGSVRWHTWMKRVRDHWCVSGASHAPSEHVCHQVQGWETEAHMLLAVGGRWGWAIFSGRSQSHLWALILP